MEREVEAVIVSFFLVVFVLAHLFGWFDVTTPIYEAGVVERREGAFVAPLLYWVGVPFHDLLGSNAFVVLPLVFMLVSVFYMLKTFSLFGLQKEIILLGFLTTSRWIPTLAFFNRDNLLFCEASVFTYLFFKAIYKNNLRSLVLQAPIIVLMLLTKAAGAFFLIIYLIEIVYFYRNKIVAFFPSAFVLPNPFQNVLEQHWSNLRSGFVWLPETKLQYISMMFTNPVFGASFFSFVHRRNNFLHGLVIVLTLLAIGVLIASFGGEDYAGRVLRYTNPLMPLHLCFFGYAVGKVKVWHRWFRIISIFIFAKVISGVFYLDAIWKVLIGAFY